MTWTEYIGSQFGKPRGIIGRICCLCMNVINRRLYASVAEAVTQNAGKHILDIGFGNGNLEKMLMRDPDVYVCGIDISPDMLKTARKRNQRAVAQGRAHLELGDCCRLVFPDGAFDAVASVNTIYFWSDTIKGLTEIRRVLKDGGVFANAVYAQEWMKQAPYTKKGFHFFSKDDYIADGKKAGFSNVVIEEIVSGTSYLIRYTK